jgi:hypothetical protein
LRRHGVGKPADLLPDGPPRPVTKPFKDCPPGFVHIDIKYLPQMPDKSQRRYLFVAIDRASRSVYLELRSSKSAASAKGFLASLLKRAPFHVRLVLTDNDKAFTDRFCATGERQPTGKHAFDLSCAEHATEHRLIPPRRPQTNGMVERSTGASRTCCASTALTVARIRRKPFTSTCISTLSIWRRRHWSIERRSKPSRDSSRRIPSYFASSQLIGRDPTPNENQAYG